MPALPPVSKVLRVALEGLFGEDTHIVNRFFLQYAGTAPTDADLTTLAGTIFSAWVSKLAAHICAGYATEQLSIEDLSSPTAASVQVLGSHAGTDTGVVIPAGGAFVMKFPIARRYRGGHPRMYFAGISNAHLTDDQTWDLTFRNAFASDWSGFINLINAGVWSGGTSLTQVNVSYYEGFTPHEYPSGRYRNIPNLRGTPVVDVISLAVANPRPGSQRRRNLQGS